MTWESDDRMFAQPLLDAHLGSEGPAKVPQREALQKGCPAMSAALDSTPIRGARAVGVITSALTESFHPLACSRSDGQPVVCSPQQLRLHRALDELGWVGLIGELNQAVRLTNSSVAEPILITTNGTILAGIGRWRSALLDGRSKINCIEYLLDEDEALQFIIRHHQPQRQWNAFIRIRLALTLEPYFQQRALDNMRAGGKYKGSANLPEAQRIDVRREIADIAGVGTRNVSNVKTILKNAHSRLLAALQEGTLTINGAMKLCRLPQAEQLEQFIRDREERATNIVIRRSIARSKGAETSTDPATVLDALQQLEARQPGSVVMRAGRCQQTVVLIGRDLLTGPHSERELKLT